MKTNLFTAMLVSVLFASCSDDNNNTEINDGRIKFTSGTNTKDTRVSGPEGNTWDAGDPIGIYMVETGTTIITKAADNRLYTALSTGLETTFTSTTPIYYPVNGSKVDFIAYHPHSTTIDENYWFEIDVQDQSSQSKIDLMTASANNEELGYDKTNTSPISLNFKHQFSKVIINVLKGDGITDLSGLSIQVKGMDHTAIFDLMENVFAGIGHIDGTVITPFNAGNNTYELILPPTEYSDLSNYKVEFTLAGNTYMWVMSDNTGDVSSFESGNKYTFDVTLTKNRVKASGTITEWNPIEGGTGTAD